MSYMIGAISRRVAIGAGTVFAYTPAASTIAARSFTSTAAAQKSPIEVVKNGAKTIDRVVSDKLVDSIVIGETLVDKAKQTTEVLSGKATGKAAELRDEATSTAKQVSGQATGKADELSGKGKGAAYEAQGKAKGTAAHAQGVAKGTAAEVQGKTNR